MSENSNARKTTENKRKMEDAGANTESKKNAKVKRDVLPKNSPYSLEDVITHLEATVKTKSELDSNLWSKFEENDKKYHDELFVIDYKIKKLEKRREHLISERLKENQGAQENVFANNRNFQAIRKDNAEELLKILKEKSELYYPCDDDNKSLPSSLIGLMDGTVAYIDFGIGGSERNAFKQFVQDNISITKTKAFVVMKGKMEGDNGQKTKFETEHTVSVVGYPNAYCPIDFEWDSFLEDYNISPIKSIIKWNNPEGWTTANFDVWVISLKNTKK